MFEHPLLKGKKTPVVMLLSGQQLPTSKEVYQHPFHLAVMKKANGEGTQRTTPSEN